MGHIPVVDAAWCNWCHWIVHSYHSQVDRRRKERGQQKTLMMRLDKKEKITLFILTVLMLFPSIFWGVDSAIGWLSGYLIGAAGVVIHLLIVFKIKHIGHEDFFKFYYTGLFLRFLVLISIMIFILVLTKIEQISFTVSFII
jgi:hypothetical protein